MQTIDEGDLDQPANTKLWSIQVLRAIAALLVVHLHALSCTFAITGHYGMTGEAGAILGRCGVDIFFVISGFIIARTSRGLTPSTFIARRATRLLPLYVMLAALYTLQAVISGHIGWRDLLATWLFWPATDRITSPLNPVAWTLCFEVLFYAGFALTIWRRKMIWVLAAIYLTALSFRSVPLFQFVGNPIILEFLAGVALAFAPKWRPALLAIPIGAGALVLGAVQHWPPLETGGLEGTQAWIRLATLGLPAVLIVWGALQVRAQKSVFTYLGDTSYALYLIHPPIVYAATLALAGFAKLPSDVAIIGAMAASTLLAWRVHELFEKPLLTRFSNFFDQARGASFASRVSSLPASGPSLKA